MTQTGRQEVIRRLAEDYAKRAKVLSIKFEDAYNMYVKRCEIRDDANLLHQYANFSSTNSYINYDRM